MIIVPVVIVIFYKVLPVFLTLLGKVLLVFTILVFPLLPDILLFALFSLPFSLPTGLRIGPLTVPG